MSVVEHARLRVREDEVEAFKLAMSEALPLIAASDGFEGIEVCQSTDQPASFLLLVRWRCIDDHQKGFRGSARYGEWRTMLHPFYDPLPEVSYFEESFV